MKIHQIVEDAYLIPLGIVNVYLLKAPNGLVLIDTGAPGCSHRILKAITSLGYQPSDLHTILLTHCHPDHVGSAAMLKNALPNVKIYCGEQDAPIIENGLKIRPMKPAPGFVNKLLFQLVVNGSTAQSVTVDGTLKDSQCLDFAGGLQAIHVPGHSLGQFAFLLPNHGGVLFTGDVASNLFGLGWSIGYEDFSTARHDLKKLGGLNFDKACFSHGRPIMTNASHIFQARWNESSN